MRRYQYRLNDQTITVGEWAKLCPLKYIDVVPGETYEGTFSVKAQSAKTVKPIWSRTYMDLYAFYVPYRLLWERFPDMLITEDETLTPPRTTNLFPQNFENSFMYSEEGEPPVEFNTAYLRRAYHLIYFSFFATGKLSSGDRANRIQDVRDGVFDLQNTLSSTYARSSTWDQSILDDTNVQDQEIDVSGGTITTRDIRAAFAFDRLNLLREYYGSKYTDYLASVGVKANWSVLEEPECIGISNNDFTFKTNKATTDPVGPATLGARNGVFEMDSALKIKKTFIPEHGLIVVMGTPRADRFNLNYPGHYRLAADTNGSKYGFFDPNFQNFPDYTIPGNLIDSTSTKTFYSPYMEHHRKGRNEVALPEGFSATNLPVHIERWSTDPGSDDILRLSAVPRIDDFVEAADSSDSGLTGLQVMHYIEGRISKRSPVMPRGKPGVA